MNIQRLRESTGVHWIPLFEELEWQGFEWLLISSSSLRRVLGRRATMRCTVDPDLAQLRVIGELASLAGQELVALRTMLRHRSQLLEHCAPQIQHNPEGIVCRLVTELVEA